MGHIQYWHLEELDNYYLISCSNDNITIKCYITYLEKAYTREVIIYSRSCGFYILFTNVSTKECLGEN